MVEMKLSRAAVGVLFGLAATFAAATCQAGILRSSSMRLGAQDAAPEGFLAWCARSPADCGDGAANSTAIATAAQDALRLQWERRIAGVQTAHPAALRDDEATVRPAPRFSFAALFARRPTGEAKGPNVKDWPRAQMDKALWARLTGVNTFVNTHVRKVSDQDQYGLVDWWATPLSGGDTATAAGDCEDFVLEKRKELIAAGVPADTLTIAMATTRQGELHAVLIAATDKGDYVLDSLDEEVRPWSRVDYRWISRQSPTDRLAWYTIRS
jgi:predicted transglutaminase-like cysteine proteinase